MGKKIDSPFVFEHVPTSPGIHMKALGQKIRAERKKKGLSLEQAAGILGISKVTLVKIEAGGDVYVSTLNHVLGFFAIRVSFTAPDDSSGEEWF